MPILRAILRRTLYTTAALSTLLLLVTLILWPVSYYRKVVASASTITTTTCAIAQAGRVLFEYFPNFRGDKGIRFASGQQDPSDHFFQWSYLTYNAWTKSIPPGRLVSANRLGTELQQIIDPTSNITFLAIPFSYLTLLFSILPLPAFRSLRRRRKAARIGLCPKCHYDLRPHHSGTAGPLCPECGTPVPGLRSSVPEGRGS